MNFIENLREKRLNWIKANRENGFEDGIRNLPVRKSLSTPTQIKMK